MNISETTIVKDLTIQGFTFAMPVVVTPEQFDESIVSVCTAEVAASILQQTLSENCRNNFAPTVTKAITAAAEENDIEFKKLSDLSDEDSQTLNDAVDLEALQVAFNLHVASYEPGVRRTSGGVSLSPVEREATKLAVEMIRNHLESTMGVGRTARSGTYKVWNAKIQDELGMSGADHIAEMAASLIEANPSITETAVANIEARKQLATGVEFTFPG